MLCHHRYPHLAPHDCHLCQLALGGDGLSAYKRVKRTKEVGDQARKELFLQAKSSVTATNGEGHTNEGRAQEEKRGNGDEQRSSHSTATTKDDEESGSASICRRGCK